MRKKIYLAGKVSGIPSEQALLKFSRKQTELEAQGFEVMNPLECIEHRSEHFNNGIPITDWKTCMKLLIPILLQCEELHLLPCWNDSKGAMLERDLALKMGITLIYH